ncbi:hypothetical protein Tco_1122309 [Tanacetum coccineum]|uniref:Uncharacterized protein n=1 Tax=Tanacetum coccineum TaxID=301880 RepID=A0ABQ5J3X4_9ASTR
MLVAEEKKRMPPTKAQKRNQMSTYLKNMSGYKHNQLKNKSYEEIEKMFDMKIRRVNSFIPMNSKVVKSKKGIEESSKGKEDELESNKSKNCRKHRNSAWFKEKAMLTEMLESGMEIPTLAAFQTDDLDTFDSDYDETPFASAVLIAKLSSYDSEVLLEVPIHDNYLNNHVIEIENAVVQDTSSSAQQDAMIMSVIKEMSKQIAKCNEVDKVNKAVNESLTTELEKYKEQIKLFEERQNCDLNNREKYLDSQLREPHATLSVMDTEETLKLAEESRLKMHAKQNYPVMQEKKVNIAPIDYVALNKLSEHFVPQKQLSTE